MTETQYEFLDDDEIDFRELMAAMIPWVIPAIVVAGLAGIGGFLYAGTIEKKYQAVSRFVVSSQGQPAIPNLGGLLDNISSGSRGSDEASRTPDIIISRDFILSLSDIAGLTSDPYFNGLEDEPGLLDKATAFLRGKPEVNPNSVTENIVDTYRESVSTLINDNRIIDLVVIHEEPMRAADVANAITKAYVARLDEKRSSVDQKQFDAMEQRLLDAQTDLDVALNNARIFAVENSMRSKEELNASSLQLSRFRRELTRLETAVNSLNILEKARRDGMTTIERQELAARSPQALDTLRQFFDWSPSAIDYRIPSALRIAAVGKALDQERGNITRSINVLQIEANQNADAAGRLAELQREAKVRETIYQGFVTQFEARNFSKSLRDTTAELIQQASVPVEAVSPRRIVFALVSAILGAMVIGILALLKSQRTNIFYFRNSIEKALGLQVNVSNLERTLRPLPKASEAFVKGRLLGGNANLSKELIAIQHDECQSVLVLGFALPKLVSKLSVLAAASVAAAEKRTAIVDLGQFGRVRPRSSGRGTFSETVLDSQVSLLKWMPAASRLRGGENFEEALKKSLTAFDNRIVVCIATENVVALSTDSLKMVDRTFVIVKKGTTTEHELEHIQTALIVTGNPLMSLMVA